MFKPLLCIGLILTAFAFWQGVDLYDVKMPVALTFALTLCMVEVYHHGIAKCQNKWFCALVVFVLIAAFLAPTSNLQIDGIGVGKFWVYQPTLKIIIYALFFLTIAGHNFKPGEIRFVLQVMVWCGVVSSVYIGLQALGIDQIFKITNSGRWGGQSGFFGNPTIAAPYSAMMVPLALALKGRENYIAAAVCMVGAIVPDSQMAWGGVVFGLVVYMALGSKWRLIAGCALALILTTSMVVALDHHGPLRHKFSDHERFTHWPAILSDWKNPIDKSPITSEQKAILDDARKNGIISQQEHMARMAGAPAYPLTGRGIGSFQYVYRMQNPDIGSPNGFAQAHNDYLEFLYGSGLVGTALFFLSLFAVFRTIRFSDPAIRKGLVASFGVMAFVAFGTFLFQIGTFQFYGVTMLGLIVNPHIYGTN